jgi:rod shape-determining protein MreD
VDLLRSLIILFPLSCLLDVLCGTVLGSYALLCFGCFLSIKAVAGKNLIRESLYQNPLIGVVYLAVNWLVYLLLELLQPGHQVPWSWWEMIIRAALVVILSYPLFVLFDLIKKISNRSYLPWNRLRFRTDNRRRRRA